MKQEEGEMKMKTRSGSWVNEMFLTDFYVQTYRDKVDDELSVARDVDGVLKLLGLPKGSHILDWCGGYGRHAIPIAKRGYRVTLLDLSPIHTRLAGREAREAGVKIRIVTKDFRKTPPRIKADGAINMFTAGIGYLSERDDLLALKSLRRALKPGATFVLDTMSPHYIARNYNPSGYTVSNYGSVRKVSFPRVYDFWTGRLISTETLYVGGRKEMVVTSSLRLYQPHELKELLEKAGFEVLSFLGSLAGEPMAIESKRLVVLSLRR